jgi:hypothetical protein
VADTFALLRRTVVVLAVLVAMLAVTFVTGYTYLDRRLNRNYTGLLENRAVGCQQLVNAGAELTPSCRVPEMRGRFDPARRGG